MLGALCMLSHLICSIHTTVFKYYYPRFIGEETDREAKGPTQGHATGKFQNQGSDPKFLKLGWFMSPGF